MVTGVIGTVVDAAASAATAVTETVSSVVNPKQTAEPDAVYRDCHVTVNVQVRVLLKLLCMDELNSCSISFVLNKSFRL